MKKILAWSGGSLAMVTFLMACGQLSSSKLKQAPGDKGQSVTYTGSGQPVPMDSLGAVSWLAHTGNQYFLKGESGNEFYLYVKLRGNEIVAQNKERVPLNISMVLDRSGSMAGDKMAYARKAAGFVVEQLSSNDILSIINYDDRIEITSPSEPVKNKEVLKRKIMELTDRGSTNLTGGMLEGYTQVQRTKKEGYVNRVLLLTDGLANTGIVEPAQIRHIVEKKYSEEGIALSTFGLGADYNENLLTQLAETGRANYYFIDNPDKIPAIFAAELKGLLSVVAQNALVEVSVPAGLACEKVYGYPFEIKNGKVQVRLNDLYAGDEKSILFKFKARTPVKEQADFVCRLQYTDASEFNNIDVLKKLQVKETTDKALLQQEQDALVQEMIALFESTEIFDEVMSRVDAGNYQDAKLLADSAIRILKDKQKYLKSEKLKEQELNLTTYNNSIDSVSSMRDEEKKMYQKANKATNYEIKKLKKKSQ